jgi:hypothetical protein
MKNCINLYLNCYSHLNTDKRDGLTETELAKITYKDRDTLQIGEELGLYSGNPLVTLDGWFFLK